MARYDVTNGNPSTGKILNNDSMYVSMGGTADNTTVNASGMLIVSNGGTADNTTVNGHWGYLIVSNGGTATNTTVNANGEFDVFSGGVAANTTVKSGGRLEVRAGGTATEITAVEGAYLGFGIGPDTFVKGASAGSAFEIKDGIAANFTLNNGYLNVASDGTADNTTVNKGGYMWVSSDGVAANTTVKSGGRLGVRAGGTATKIAAVEGAYLEFDVAPDTYIAGTSAGAAFEIKDGSVANFTLDRGFLHVSAGGTADNTTVNHIGLLVISSGGTANNTTLNKGYFIVSNGGTADNTTVNSGGSMWVSSGGKADNTTVNGISFHQGGYFDVSSGGTADNTTVNSGGCLTVYKGGTADNTTVNDWGTLYVEDGGTATNTTVNGSGNTIGEVWVYDSGILNNTTVNALGQILLFGTATNTTVNSGGYLCLQSGGTATEIEAVDGAYLLFAVAPDTYAKGTSAGSAFEIKNGVVTNFTLTCGELILYSGCTANKTTVSGSGYLVLRSAGKATNTTVNNGGVFEVSSGGTADNTTVNDTGKMYIERGLAESTTVKSGGSMRVVTGGTANSVTVSSGGKLDLFEDGVLTGRMTFSSGALVSAYEGGGIIDFDLTHTSPSKGALVNDLSIVKGTPMYTLTVNGAQGIGAYRLADGASEFGSKTEITVRNPVGTDLGILTVDSKSNTFSYGGKSYTLQLNDASLVIIVNSESGSPNIVTGDVNGHTVITEGSSALGVNVNGGGMLEIQPHGKGNNIMVGNGGLLLTKDAQVKGVTVDKGGVAYLGSDTVMESLVLNGGEAHVESDGWAFQMSKGKTVSSNTIVKNDGMLYISGGGHVEGLLASDGGRVIVENDGSLEVAKVAGAAIDALGGAIISSATLLEGGRMNVFAGGSAQNVTVSEGGILSVESGGELNNIYVSAGGVLTGVVKDGTTIRMYGGTLDFDISGFTPNSAPAYLYEDTDIESDEAYPCTLTVGDAQAYGTYGLMSYAYGFGCTVTVQDTSGKELGTLAAGSAVNINGVDYTLNIGGSPAYPLTVTIADNEAPSILNIAADITDPTTSNVTVTAEFSDNVALASKQYRIGDGGAWTDYTTGVTVTENTTVYFKAVDTAGNETTDQYVVTNIDRENPEVLNVTANITDPTNQNVTVTADFSDKVALASKQYRIGDGAWTDYVDGVTVTENATVYFKAVDTAGNESAVAEYTVGNIDKVAPTITKIKPNTTEPTDSVTITAKIADNVALASKQYRIGDGAWTDYTTGVTVTENATVYFKAVDTAGNETTDQYVVTNIETVEPDTEKPTVTEVKANITGPTNQNVTVTAKFSDNVAVASSLYKIGDGAWTAYPAGGVVVTANATVYFKAVDTSGNESEVVSHKVANIDKVPPATPTVSASTTKPTNGSVTVTATFRDDTEVKEYSLDGSSWAAYPGAVKFDDNGSVYFRATDAVGNVSEVAGYEVANIDKIPPAKPTATADVTETTGGAVTVTIKYSKDSAKKEYSLDGLVWQIYTAPLVFEQNGKVWFRGTDAAGNVSAINSYEVTNIEIVGPENKPDDGTNDYLYRKKATPEWNNANIHVTNEITGNGEVLLDLPGSVDMEGGCHNMFGNDGTNKDTGDVAQIEVNEPAKLTFTIDSTAAGTFYVYQDGKDKKGNRKQITVKKVTVKAGKTATLEGVCLTADGKYYAAMVAKNVKKAGTEGLYNVNVTESKFFVDADKGGNNAASDSSMVLIGRGAESQPILLDWDPMTGGTEFKNFVGFTDGKDYIKLDLASSAYLKFNVTGDGDGKAKFTLWKQDAKGKLSKVTGVSLPAKKVYDATTKAQFLDASKYTYYVSMECTDAAKGKGVYYNVQVTDDAVFFDSADKGMNNELYDKKAKKFCGEDASHHFKTTGIGTGPHVKLDTDPVGDSDWENFVGYEDPIDYAKIELRSAGNLSFQLQATGNATFTFYRKGQDRKGNDTLEAVQTSKLALAKGASLAEADMLISGLEAGEYYVSMAAKSTKANDKGSVFYNVTAFFSDSPSSSLAMPETSDSLAMADSLSFGGYDADALASASASSLAGLDDKSAWQNLLA